jgi:hypothetical protein
MDRDDSSGIGKVAHLSFLLINPRALLGTYRSVNKISRRILERLELAILEVEE